MLYKGHSPPVELLTVIGTIVALSLTALAVLMIIGMAMALFGLTSRAMDKITDRPD